MTEQKLSIFDVLKNLLDYIEENDVTDIHKVSPWLTSVEDYDENDNHTENQRSAQFNHVIKEATETLDSYRHLPYPPSEEAVKKCDEIVKRFKKAYKLKETSSCHSTKPMKTTSIQLK